MVRSCIPVTRLFTIEKRNDLRSDDFGACSILVEPGRVLDFPRFLCIQILVEKGFGGLAIGKVIVHDLASIFGSPYKFTLYHFLVEFLAFQELVKQRNNDIPRHRVVAVKW